MPFSDAPYDTPTIGLMRAALETAWLAAGLQIPGLSNVDRSKMEGAILIAAARGERNFRQLQQHAIDTLGARAVEAPVTPIERRQRLWLVKASEDRRRR
jgi:hypothetical protein